MRDIFVRHGSILIASVAGELRHISVSGLAKVRLLWLFRNFCVLNFSVLNKQQQQLIAQVWQAGASPGSGDVLLEPIGTIEAFSPQLCQPSAPIRRPGRPSAPFGLSGGLPIRAVWTGVGVLLLGCALYLGPMHRWMPQSDVAAAAASNVSSTFTLPAQPSAESAPSVANLLAAASEASSVPAFHPPEAMARDASSLKSSLQVKLQVKPPHPGVAVSTKAVGKPEVVIRVSVDGAGRARGFQILRGERKISAALAAARHWSFQPCSSSAGCEHSLKFTDYGGAFIVQRID